MAQPFFTIIVPIKNGKRFLSRFTDSLLSQSFQDWEAIIVDDNSTDYVYIDLLKLQARYKKIRVFRIAVDKVFSGPYAARNFALEKSIGRYLLFWDIDDYWIPSHLQLYYQFLCTNPSIRLLFSPYCRYKWVPNKKIYRISVRLVSPPRLVKILSNAMNPIPMLTACIDSTVVSTKRFLPIGHEDFLFWNCLLREIDSSQIACTRCITSFYSVSFVSHSGDKLVALKWVYSIYQTLGYPLFKSLFLCIIFLAYQLLLRFMESSIITFVLLRLFQPKIPSFLSK
jgi:teichuronic acid biosynthesis glycosyltransferase TuaG